MLSPSMVLSRSASSSLNCVLPCSFWFRAVVLICIARAMYCSL